MVSPDDNNNNDDDDDFYVTLAAPIFLSLSLIAVHVMPSNYGYFTSKTML